MLEHDLERKLAAHLFNETWRLLDKTDRPAQEAMARAFSLSDKTAARVHYQAALDLELGVEDKDERNILQSDLLTNNV